MLNTSNHVKKHKYVKVFKSFALQPISEIYKDFNNGKEIYFLNGDNEPVKVSSISKENYKGKIYDVTVPNHILLVKRNGKAVWSGNSYYNINMTYNAANKRYEVCK